MNQALIIFIKNPVLGNCKTRLAKSIGDEEALKVYKKLLSHTKSVALNVDAKRYLFYDSSINDNDEWSSQSFEKQLQHQGDLGLRMKKAFEFVLEKHSKAVIIGSDCPEINSSIIEDSFNALNSQEVVLGPSHDGGYYLLGMTKFHSHIFDNVQWSTSSVFQQTLDKLKDDSISFGLLPTLYDLDTIEDLERFPQFNS